MASRNRDLDKRENVAKKFLNWKNLQTVKVIDGEEYKKITGGEFQYYEKDTINPETNEPGLTVSVSKPFEFAVLDSDCYSFKGNDKSKDNRYVWSNEVSKYTKDVELKCKEGSLLKFTTEEYKNKDTKAALKEKIKGLGAKYTQSVYIAVREDEDWEIWNIQLGGGSLSGGNDPKKKIEPEDLNDGWFGFTKQAKGKILTHTIVVDQVKPKKNGDVSFMIPVYEVGEPINKQDNERLSELAKEVEEFLKYKASVGTKEDVEEPVAATEEEDYTK